MSNINDHMWNHDPIINNFIDNEPTIDIFVKNLPDIRVNIIQEVIYRAVRSYSDQFDLSIQSHYFDGPFKNVAELIANGIYEIEYFKTEYLGDYVTEYSLTHNEIDLIILIYKKAYYLVYNDFCKVAVNLNFRVFDSDHRLTTDINYLNGISLHEDSEDSDDDE